MKQVLIVLITTTMNWKFISTAFFGAVLLAGAAQAQTSCMRPYIETCYGDGYARQSCEQRNESKRDSYQQCVQRYEADRQRQEQNIYNQQHQHVPTNCHMEPTIYGVQKKVCQ
jgi:hypothetical protein